MVTAKARDLMSVTELAKLLFVSKTYVRKKLLRRHTLRPVIVRRGRVRVSKKGRSIGASGKELRAGRCASWRVFRKISGCTKTQRWTDERLFSTTARCAPTGGNGRIHPVLGL